MKKITDKELLIAIWERQISQLSHRVISNFIGGNIAVCDGDKTYYEFSSHISQTSRHLLTNKIGPKQLLKRIRLLNENGLLKIDRYGAFYIDNSESFEAFKFARNWWCKAGVPTGYSKEKCTDGRYRTTANTVSMPGWKTKALELKEILMQKYANP